MRTPLGGRDGGVMRRRGVLCLTLLAATGLATHGQSPEAEETKAAAVARKHAGYVLPDGTIQIVTCSRLAGVVRVLNQVYAAAHPGVKFKVLEGDNYSAMAALTFDRSAFAPLGTEYTRIGLGDNLKIAAEPVGFRIAHASLSPGAGVPALGVIVNRANPIASLSMAQLTRMFAVGGPAGDIATWGQAGVAGPLAEREVHPVGPMPSDYTDSEDPQAGEFLSTDKMGGLNMNHRYAGMVRYADVVERVKEDSAAIGITALNVPLGDVKVIGLKSETGSASQGSAADIAARRYPMDREAERTMGRALARGTEGFAPFLVYIYLRVGKGMPLDSFGQEYVRMVLSDEGQRTIAAEAAGYIPLNAGELAEERARLNR